MASLALQQQRLLTRPPAVSQAGARIRGQLPPGIQAQVPIQLENMPQFRLNAPQGLSQNFQVCYTVKQENVNTIYIIPKLINFDFVYLSFCNFFGDKALHNLLSYLVFIFLFILFPFPLMH